MKNVTLCYIRSVRPKSKKITLEEAVDLIKDDCSHSKYGRRDIQKALKKGIKIQLNNHTLQMVGVGVDRSSEVSND